MDRWQPLGLRWKESFMHGIESCFKGRDRFLKGSTCWEAPMLRRTSIFFVSDPLPFFVLIPLQWKYCWEEWTFDLFLLRDAVLDRCI